VGKAKRKKEEGTGLSLDKIIDLDDFSFSDDVRVVKNKIDESDMLVIPATYKDSKYPACPKCGSHNVYLNQHRTKRVRDLDLGGKHVAFDIDSVNYVCQECGKTYTKDSDSISRYSRMTERMKDAIGRQALDTTFTKLGEIYAIAPSTASIAFGEWVKAQDQYRSNKIYAPKVLGIDEAHLSKVMRGVFVNDDNMTLLDLTESRNKDTIIDWLRALQNPNNLQAVTIDMWAGYRDAVKEVFGDRVSVVVDPFHVIQALQIDFQKCPNNITVGLPDGTLKAYANYAGILKRNIEDLKPGDKETLARLLKEIPDLTYAYALKESFRSLYRCQTRAEAEEHFEDWVNQIPTDARYKPFKHTATMVKHWHKEIFNFFDHGHVTNAGTEGRNRVIKLINKMGSGYSFDVLRAKLLYGKGSSVYQAVKIKKTKKVTTGGSSGNAPYGYFQPIKTKTVEYYENTLQFGVPINDLIEDMESGEFFKRNRREDDNKNEK